MATYRYLAYDVRALTPVAELPLAGVQFNTTLNRVGQLTGSIPVMSDPGIQAAQINSQVIPGRTALFVDRDGALVWGGIIWQSFYQRSTDAWQITASTYESYFSRRRIRVDKVYSGQDQLAVVRDLITYAQGITGGNINVSVTSNTSGQLVTARFPSFERRVILDEINTLSQASNGFDYAIDCQYVSGTPALTLNLGYPRRGRTAGTTGLMFELPGNVTDYTLPNDASKMALTVDATGQNNNATNAAPLVSSSSITSYIDAGWPLLEDVVASKGINDATMLGNFVAAQAISLGQPAIIPQVMIDPGIDPILGSYMTGDEARFRLTGPMFAGTLDTYYRIIDIAVTPGEGGSHDTATLTLGPTLGY